MRAALLLAVFAVAVPDRPNPTPKEEPKTPQDQILGEWRLDKIEAGGDGGVALDQDKKNHTLLFTRTEIIVSVNGQPTPADNTGYTIDWMKNPIAIDILPRNGPMKKVEGILKLESDQLTICFSVDGGRPTDFNIAAGKLTALMHLKRVKK